LHLKRLNFKSIFVHKHSQHQLRYIWLTKH